MRLIALLAALLIAMPANAQQRGAQQRRPAPPQLVSGWTVPIQNFVTAFNATATRLSVEDRAVMTDCADRGTPVRTCAFRIGPSLPGHVVAADDRSTLKDISVFLDPNLGALGIGRLMAAFGTLSHHFEPNVAMGERSAALSALFDVSTIRNRPNTVTLGTTTFTMMMLPGIQVILSAEPAR